MNELVQYWQQAWLNWGQTAVVLGGTAVVWILSRAQSIGEIRKLQAELVSLRVNQFEKIIALDEKQRGIVERVYEQLRVLLQAVHQQDASTAKSARDAAQKVFLLEYIGAYFHYVSIGRWIFPEARYELTDDEVIPFLETSALLLESMNQPAVLTLTGQQALMVNDFDFNFAFRFAKKHTRFWEVERKRKLRNLENRLLQKKV